MELYEDRLSFVTIEDEIKWLRCYAEAEIAEARFELATQLYIVGDAKAAFSWMRKAADTGHTRARSRLDFFREFGEGCTRQMKRRLHRGHAVEKGHAIAPFGQAQSLLYLASDSEAEHKNFLSDLPSVQLSQAAGGADCQVADEQSGELKTNGNRSPTSAADLGKVENCGEISRTAQPLAEGVSVTSPEQREPPKKILRFKDFIRKLLHHWIARD